VGLRRSRTLALAVLLAGTGHDDAWAHAGLRFSNPAGGATLGDSPKLVELTFREKPEARLSEIRVIDTAGTAHQLGGPQSVAGAPFALAVRVRPLERGVYTVSWRTLSSVDGHVTAGAFAFGVRMKPTGVVGGLPPAYPAPSAFEMTARFLLIVGLVALLGAAAATVARFGGASDAPLGAAGWLLAVAGLVLLALAQWRHAAASFAIVLDTSVGRPCSGAPSPSSPPASPCSRRGRHGRNRGAARWRWPRWSRWRRWPCTPQQATPGLRAGSKRRRPSPRSGHTSRPRESGSAAWPACCWASAARRRETRPRP
jgi:methionine-rich copper-binding protein CopC